MILASEKKKKKERGGVVWVSVVVDVSVSRGSLLNPRPTKVNVSSKITTRKESFEYSNKELKSH